MKRVIVWMTVLGLMFSAPAFAGKKPAKKKQVKVIKKVIKKGHKKKRGFLGVHLIKLNGELRIHFGASKEAGVMIAKVEKDSPADKAGLKVGDVLVEVDGEKVGSAREVQRIIGKKQAGEKSELKVVRDKRERKLVASIEVRRRSLVEVSRFLKWSYPGGGEELEVEFDQDNFDWAMEGVQEHLDDLGMPKKIFKFHKIESDIEERLEKMEEKLKKLEKKLQGRLLMRSREKAGSAG